MGSRFRDDAAGDNFQGRDTPPTHYSFKIQSFSSLSKASIEKYNSDEFEVGEYKWRLTIYPTGNKDRGGKGFISFYLGLVDTALLPPGWEVKAIFNLLVFDRTRDKYFSISDGKVYRFHAMRTALGKPKFIDLEIFNDPSNGYLINDNCVFGVDIFVLKQTRKGECSFLMEQPVTNIHTWRIKSMSALLLDHYESNAFTVEDYKWRIRIYPQGLGNGKGNSISVFLSLDGSTLPPDTRLFVKYILRVVGQNQVKADPFEFKGVTHFGPSCLVWGAPKFMSLSKLNDPNNKYLVDDTCIIAAQVTLLGIVSTA